jgi:hypothetical protein
MRSDGYAVSRPLSCEPAERPVTGRLHRSASRRCLPCRQPWGSRGGRLSAGSTAHLMTYKSRLPDRCGRGEQWGDRSPLDLPVDRCAVCRSDRSALVGGPVSGRPAAGGGVDVRVGPTHARRGAACEVDGVAGGDPDSAGGPSPSRADCGCGDVALGRPPAWEPEYLAVEAEPRDW